MMNGTRVQADDPFWNFLVQVHVKGSYRCTGSAINDYFVLTAAHCLLESKKSNTKIVANYLSDDFNGIYEISKIIIHNKYNKFTRRYDFGLIKVERRLPSKFELLRPWQSLSQGQICRYAGWGADQSRFGNTSNNLNEQETFVQWTKDDQILTRDKGGSCTAGQVY